MTVNKNLKLNQTVASWELQVEKYAGDTNISEDDQATKQFQHFQVGADGCCVAASFLVPA